MEKMNGWSVYVEDELTVDNTVIVLDEMISKINEDISCWKKDSGMYKLLSCQREALGKAKCALQCRISSEKSEEIEKDC